MISNNKFTIFNESDFNKKIINLLNEIEKTQSNKLKEVAKVVYEAMDSDGLLHVFSTGHSHMVAEELFYRSGGLIPVNPILEPELMLHEGALKSSKLERIPGYAAVIFNSVKFRQGEPIIIVSNSGINSVPIEMALLAKQNALKVIAITSVNVSSSLKSRHPSGKKLMDVADIVIDNCIKNSDSVGEVKETGQKFGAISSVAGIYIAQKIVFSVVNEFLKNGKKPPTYMSANIPGGDKHNESLIKKYEGRIRCLY